MSGGATPLSRVLMVDRDLSAKAGQLMNQYFGCLDLWDFEGAAACFTADASSEYGGLKLERGRAAIVEFLRGALGSALSSRHAGTSVVAERTSDTTARCETAAVVHIVRVIDGEPPQLHIRGVRYSDELVLVDGEWLIGKRVHRGEWAAVHDVTVLDEPEFRRGADGSLQRR